LPRRFSRPLDIEDEPTNPLPIPPSSILLFGGKMAGEQIFQKERAQGFDRVGGQGGSKAAEGRGGRPAGAPEPGHEGDRTGMHNLVERFQRPFATESVSEEHGEKIKHVVASEASSRTSHALTDLVEASLLLQVGCNQSHFTQPRWGCRLRFRSGLDTDRSISDTPHICLLERM
jgi:hypothetical protein